MAVLKDRKRTPVDRRARPAPPLPKRARVVVGHPAVRVRRKEAPTPSTRDITGPAHGSSDATTAKSPGAPAAAHQGGGKGAAAAGGAIVAKPLAAALTPAALGDPRGEAAPTATAAAVTRTATATTAQRAADGGAPSVPRTLSTSGGAVEVAGDPGGISTPPPPRTTPAHVHAATAGGSGTGDTITAAREAPAAGAAAPAPDRGGAATAAAGARRVAPPAPTKAPLTGEVPGVEQTATRIAGTSTALGSTVPSLLGHHHEALTVTATHPPLRL